MHDHISGPRAGWASPRRVRPIAGAKGIALVVVLTASVLSACGSSKGSASSSTVAGTQGSTIGITPKQITVGNVATIGGPVPGIFAGAPNGLKAYLAYINSKGGVNGRQIVMKSGDDAGTCAQNLSATQALEPEVAAFVGDFSINDNCAASVFTTNTELPTIAYFQSPTIQGLPNSFNPQNTRGGWRTGPYIYYKQQYPQAVGAVGSLYVNSASVITSWNNQKAAMNHVGGYHVVYERGVSPSETDFTADVVRMRAAGVKAVIVEAINGTILTQLLNTIQQQNWHPQLIVTNIAYGGTFLKTVNPGAADGVLDDQQVPMYLGEDRAVVPEVNLFLEWMNKVNPGFAPDIFSLYAWASGEMFVQALQAAGSNPTRQSILAQLQKIHQFDANGLVAPTDPASKVAPVCWMLLKVQNNGFQRVTPSKGFTCSGEFYVNPSKTS